jgi:hypothetical protein
VIDPRRLRAGAGAAVLPRPLAVGL